MFSFRRALHITWQQQRRSGSVVSRVPPHSSLLTHLYSLITLFCPCCGSIRVFSLQLLSTGAGRCCITFTCPFTKPVANSPRAALPWDDILRWSYDQGDTRSFEANRGIRFNGTSPLPRIITPGQADSTSSFCCLVAQEHVTSPSSRAGWHLQETWLLGSGRRY